MKMKHSYRPALEGLEARWVPATIRLIGGNLFVSSPASNPVDLKVIATGNPGEFNVLDGAKSVTVSGVGGLIAITGSNKLDTITVDTTALAFPGSLMINARNGNDDMKLAGTIGGNLTVLGGFGNDTLTVTAPAKVGGSLGFNGGIGVNRLQCDDDLKVGGSLVATGLSDLSAKGDLNVGGNATLVANPSASLTFAPAADVVIGGSLAVGGSSANDKIDLSDTTLLDVGGNVTFNLLGGANIANLIPTVGTVSGNLGLTAGAGDDTVLFGAALEINGNAAVSLGEGANAFDTSLGNAVFGNLSLRVGNGNNLAMDLDGDVGGTLSIYQGNGDNSAVTISIVPARLVYRGGNGGAVAGDNSIVLTGVGTYLVDMVYGTGFGDLTLNNLNLFLTGVVRGTGGSYTLTQTAGTLTPDLSLINFP